MPKKVLVVDDSAVDRMLFKGIVERLPNYTVIEAEHGEHALEQIDSWNIDIVVTDMQMPVMDGLELVRVLRKDHPEIPTILATSHGNAEIATKALSEGAAGYVPKAELNELLMPTISNIVSRLEHESNFAKLIDHSKDISFRFELENDPKLFAPLIELTCKMIAGISPTQRIDRLRLGIAIEQALHNALFRGNLELPNFVRVPFGDESPEAEVEDRIASRLSDPRYSQRRINVGINITPAGFVCRVKDDGPGFDPATHADPLFDESRRGLVLMRAFMDNVDFNDVANEVTLTATWKDKHRLDEVEDTGEILGFLLCKQSGKEVKLTNFKCIVGADESSHLIIADKSISPHHCLFLFRDGIWHVIDLNSASGTSVNGKPIKQSKLKPEDVIGIGDFELQIKYHVEPMPA